MSGFVRGGCFVVRAALRSIRGTEGLCPSVCRWPAWAYMALLAGDVDTAVAFSVAASSLYVLRFGVYEIHTCIWPAVCSPFHVFSYASMGDLSVRLLIGCEGLESGPLVLYTFSLAGAVVCCRRGTCGIRGS